jgi:hypothetical protein
MVSWIVIFIVATFCIDAGGSAHVTGVHLNERDGESEAQRHPRPPRDTSPRMRQLDQLLSSYKASHNIFTLNKNHTFHSGAIHPSADPSPLGGRLGAVGGTGSICDRQFIVSQVFCRDAGNGIGLFLDNFAWAIILNRTLIADFVPKASHCHGSLRIQRWIPSLDALLPLLKDAGCPYSKARRAMGTERGVACCNLEQLPNATFLNPGATMKMSFAALNSLRGSGRILSVPAQQRFRALFSNLDGISSLEAFGFLTMHSIRFLSPVKSLTHGALEHVQDTTAVSFGVHVRHQKLDVAFERRLDDDMEQCLSALVPPRVQGRNCTLLIATDRSHTLERLERFAGTMGCVPKYVQRSLNTTHRTGEHGPWGESVISMADFYLLSQAHYFLGTSISSFSTIIANMVAANAAVSGSQHPARWSLPSTNASQLLSPEPFMWGLRIRSQKSDAISCFPYKDPELTKPARDCRLSTNYYNYTSERCVINDKKTL